MPILNYIFLSQVQDVQMWFEHLSNVPYLRTLSKNVYNHHRTGSKDKVCYAMSTELCVVMTCNKILVKWMIMTTVQLSRYTDVLTRLLNICAAQHSLSKLDHWVLMLLHWQLTYYRYIFIALKLGILKWQ